MEAIKMQYTVRPEFVEQNKANIRRVIDALRRKPIDGIRYASFTLDDGETFVHFNFFESLEVQARFQALKEFRAFRKALRASKPVAPPRAERMDLVASGFDL